ncbi:MAG: hypothetical protein HFI88_00010 [Lachnospiraceae bacterium]|nr:hypothetical protein [Lachnospiraceae bacterium]
MQIIIAYDEYFGKRICEGGDMLAGKYQAATWESCVVKIADKIAYVGRDVENAISLGFLDHTD